MLLDWKLFQSCCNVQSIMDLVCTNCSLVVYFVFFFFMNSSYVRGVSKETATFHGLMEASFERNNPQDRWYNEGTISKYFFRLISFSIKRHYVSSTLLYWDVIFTQFALYFLKNWGLIVTPFTKPTVFARDWRKPFVSVTWIFERSLLKVRGSAS